MHLISFVLCLSLICGPGEGMFLFSGFKPASSPEERFVEASNAFSIHLYKRLAIWDDNVFICPLCIATSMAMLMEGARDKTRMELNETLKFKQNRLPLDELRKSYAELTNRMRESDCLANTANSFFVQQGYEVSPNFRDLIQDVYNTNISEVDFANSQQSVFAINEWIKHGTKGKITHLFDSVESRMQMLLVNAVHFNACFANTFDNQPTFKEKFYIQGIEDRYVEVFMMEKKGNTQKLANSYDFRAVELPCGEDFNSTLKLWVLLPHKMGNLVGVDDGLSTATFRQLKKSFRDIEIDISIPRIKFEFTSDITKELQRLGIQAAFSPDKADFSEMSNSKGLFLSEVIHKAIVDINDGKKESPSLELSRLLEDLPEDSAEPTPEDIIPPFKANHPFVFCVVDTRTGLILYMGRLAEF